MDADAAVGEGLGDLACVGGLEPDVSVGRVVSLFGDGSWCGCWAFPLYAMLGVAWKGVGVEEGAKEDKGERLVSALAYMTTSEIFRMRSFQ